MEQMTEAIRALLDAEGWLITNLANTAAVIYERMQDINWAGFYLMRQGELQLGPFQGKAACLRIPLGKGVCGTGGCPGADAGWWKMYMLLPDTLPVMRLPILRLSCPYSRWTGGGGAGYRQPAVWPLWAAGAAGAGRGCPLVGRNLAAGKKGIKKEPAQGRLFFILCFR